MDDLLGLDPVKTEDVIPKAEIDPTQLIDHAGQLKELGLDYGWGLTTVFERTIEQIYLNSGWGWAGSIMVAGVAVRCATFFFQALSSDKMAALAALKPLTSPIQEKLDDAIARGDKAAEQRYKMQQAQIMQPHMGGVFSMGGFMIVQAWIGISAFRCLRAMGELPVPGMAHDGFFWFKDLTTSDPYYILPAAITGIFYAIFKVC
jgi:YidC/Oxa1 family membrane protein insertase